MTTDEIAADYAISIDQLAEREPNYGPTLVSAPKALGATVRSAIDGALNARSPRCSREVLFTGPTSSDYGLG